MPFQPGNEYSKKSKTFSDALRRAIAQDDGKKVRAAAEKLMELAAKGECWAVKELADRLDGKPGQRVEIAGDEENPLRVSVEQASRLAAKVRGLSEDV